MKKNFLCKSLCYFLLSVVIIFNFSSCKHNDDIAPEDNLDFTTTTDYSTTSKNNSNLFATINYYLNQIEEGNKSQDSVVITVTPQEPDSFPKTITIDFGTGVVCYDGYTRKGKIILYLTGRWALEYVQPNTTILAEFDNYYIKPPNSPDFIKREGQFSTTYNGRDSSDHPVYVRDAIDAKLIFSDGTFIHWNASHICTWMEGYETQLNIYDNVWKIEGASSGTNRNGRQYQTNITSPLIFDRTCNNGTITQGVLIVSPENLPQRTINFGNGNCDNTIVITVNGNNYTINN